MCLHPIQIKNPNYGLHSANGHFPQNKYKDTHSVYMLVPCGRCAECLHNRQISYIERCQLQSFSHYFFFCTLTYNQESLPIIDVINYNDGKSYSMPYADYHDICNFFKRIRNNDIFCQRDFKYIAVSEFGSKKHRPHWHVLFAIQKLDSDDIYTPFNLEFQFYHKVLACWVRNTSTNRKHPSYSPLSTPSSRRVSGDTYDFHFVIPRNGSEDDVSFYVTKYILKPDKFSDNRKSAIFLSYPKSQAIELWNIIKPRILLSKGFGKPDTSAKLNHIYKGLDLSTENPIFLNPHTGQTFPLSRYLKNYIRLKDVDKYNKFVNYASDGSVIFKTTKIDPFQAISKSQKFEKQKLLILKHPSYE